MSFIKCVRAKNEGEWLLIQELLFSLGYKWFDGHLRLSEGQQYLSYDAVNGLCGIAFWDDGEIDWYTNETIADHDYRDIIDLNEFLNYLEEKQN